MPAMVSLKRSKADLKAQQERTASPVAWSDPDKQGVRLELEHHHLMNLKGADGQPIAGQLKSGNRVAFQGAGTVERSESRSTPEGERHSATIRLHRGAVQHSAPKREAAAPKARKMPGTPSYPKEAGEYVK